MREMSGAEYSRIAYELSSSLSGKRLQKVQKVSDGEYRLKFEKFDVSCVLGRRIHITNYIEEAEEADNFVQKVKKELEGRKLEYVRQLNSDRIIEFSFGEFGSLVFEMFKKGNALLLKDNVIMAVLSPEKWATRELRVGVPYVMPPAPPKSLSEAISEKMIVTSLIRLSLGKEYALELLKRCSINEKTPGASLSKEQISLIEKELSKLLGDSPRLYTKDGKTVDFSITSLSSHADATEQSCPTLSEAMDKFYSENKDAVAEPEELTKLKNRLEKQKEYLAALEVEEQQMKESGDWFYSNYQKTDSLLKDAKKVGVNNLEQLKENYPEIKEINKEKKSVTLLIQ